MAIERFNSLFLIRQMAVLLHRMACQYHIVEFVANTVRWRKKEVRPTRGPNPNGPSEQ